MLKKTLKDPRGRGVKDSSEKKKIFKERNTDIIGRGFRFN